MPKIKADPAQVVLIGDIVASRETADRQGLHDRLTAVLDAVNAAGPVTDPAVVTLGDEFQGLYPTLGVALTASFRIRAGLYPHDVRFGAGRGEANVLDRERGIHDGPAYWAARDAIERAAKLADKAALRTTRTVFCSAEDDPGHVAAVNAALLALDQVVGSLSVVSRRIVIARMAGTTQREIAAAEGITPSAVSQRVLGDGIGVALEAMRMLGGLT